MGQNRQNTFCALLYLYFACLLLILPFRWLVGWVFAIVIHELGHIAAVWICGGKIISLSAIPGGLDMTASPMPKVQRFLCILCGPVIGLSPVLLRSWLPELAVFSFILTIYNLIPVRPLDGGRLLELVVGNSGVVYCIIERLILGAIVLVCICLSLYYRLGILPYIIAADLVMKNRKFTCKRGVGAVQ